MFVTTGTGTAVGSVKFFDSGVNFSSAVVILCGESQKALQGKNNFLSNCMETVGLIQNISRGDLKFRNMHCVIHDFINDDASGILMPL